MVTTADRGKRVIIWSPVSSTVAAPCGACDWRCGLWRSWQQQKGSQYARTKNEFKIQCVSPGCFWQYLPGLHFQATSLPPWFWIHNTHSYCVCLHITQYQERKQGWTVDCPKSRSYSWCSLVLKQEVIDATEPSRGINLMVLCVRYIHIKTKGRNI